MSATAALLREGSGRKRSEGSEPKVTQSLRAPLSLASLLPALPRWKSLWLLALLFAAAPAHAAAPGTAEQFLQRAERLLGKGPLALLDGDFKRLSREGEAAGTSIRLEREKAEREGRPILYCSPKPRAELGNMEFIRGLRAIPRAERQRMSLRSAMLLVIQRKYPCRR
jgi:hypothetical protein